jgi:glucokinase
MDTYIGVDIGGTQIRAAVYPAAYNDRPGVDIRPLKQKRIPTQGKSGPPLERLMELVAEIWPVDEKVCGIGVAAPGPNNPKLGVIYRAPNIPGWEKLPVVQIMQERFHVPVFLGNDANLAALGEWKFGAGQGHHHLLYVTISTGIGGGVIIDDQLLLGSHGLAAEVGHVTVDPNGPLCGCGHRGHLEAFASGTAIARYVSEQLAQGVPSSLSEIPNPGGRDISMAAENGDPLAKAALARAGTYMGRALADYLHIFNPTIIILGGGVSRSGAFLIEPLRAAMLETIISPEYMHGLVITTAALGDDAGLLGALALAQTSQR